MFHPHRIKEPTWIYAGFAYSTKLLYKGSSIYKLASILKISTKFKFSSPLTPRSDKILDKVITYSQKLPYLPVFLDKINTTINHYIALLNILVKLI